MKVCQRCGNTANLSFGRCEVCRAFIAHAVSRLLGLDGASWDASGLEIDWDDGEKLLEACVPDLNMETKTLTRTMTALDWWNAEQAALGQLDAAHN